jgi:hypothetical protein
MKIISNKKHLYYKPVDLIEIYNSFVKLFSVRVHVK